MRLLTHPINAVPFVLSTDRRQLPLALTRPSGRQAHWRHRDGRPIEMAHDGVVISFAHDFGGVTGETTSAVVTLKNTSNAEVNASSAVYRRHYERDAVTGLTAAVTDHRSDASVHLTYKRQTPHMRIIAIDTIINERHTASPTKFVYANDGKNPVPFS